MIDMMYSCRSSYPGRPSAFIECRPHLGNERFRHLERSKAMAHAARIRHQRRRALRRTYPVALCPSWLFPNRVDYSHGKSLEHSEAQEGQEDVVGFDAKPEVLSHSTHDGQVQSLSSPQPDIGLAWSHFLRDIPLTDRNSVRQAAEFATSVILPAMDLPSEVFNTFNIYCPLMTLFSRPLFYDVAIAMSDDYCQRGLYRDPTKKRAILWRIARATRKVRAHLERPDWHTSEHEGLSMAIMCLALLEAVAGRPGTTMQHLTGLKQVLNQVDCSNDPIKEQSVIKVFECSWVIHTNKAVLNPEVRQWDPLYPAQPLDKQLLALGKSLPKGFWQLIQTRQLSMDFINVLARANGSGALANTSPQQRAQAAKRKELRVYEDFVDACPVLTAPNHDQNLLEKILTYSVLIYCSIVPDSSRVILATTNAARSQLMKIIDIYRPASLIQWKALYWATILVTDAHRVGDVIKPEALSWLQCCMLKYPELAAMDWGEIECILYSFFWNSSMSIFWRELWPELLSK